MLLGGTVKALMLICTFVNSSGGTRAKLCETVPKWQAVPLRLGALRGTAQEGRGGMAARGDVSTSFDRLCAYSIYVALCANTSEAGQPVGALQKHGTLRA